jgi:hypothetical protein
MSADLIGPDISRAANRYKHEAILAMSRRDHAISYSAAEAQIWLSATMKGSITEVTSFDLLALPSDNLWLLGLAAFMAVALLAWAAIVAVRVVRGAGSGPSSTKYLDGWTPIEPRLGKADFAE